MINFSKTKSKRSNTFNIMAYSTNFSIEELRFDNNGLIPAIAQDWLDGSILMLAWMNKESLNKTLETRNVHYWSRSRSEIWRKGATSGSTQSLKEIRFDCDNDALVLSIEQNGSGAIQAKKVVFSMKSIVIQLIKYQRKKILFLIFAQNYLILLMKDQLIL